MSNIIPESIVQELAKVEFPEPPYERVITFEEKRKLRKIFPIQHFSGVDEFGRIFIFTQLDNCTRTYVEAKDLALLK